MMTKYEAKNSFYPSLMDYIARDGKNKQNLRSINGLFNLRANTAAYAIETLRYVGNRLWKTLPNATVNFHSLEVFESRISRQEQLDRMQDHSRRWSLYQSIVYIWISGFEITKINIFLCLL